MAFNRSAAYMPVVAEVWSRRVHRPSLSEIVSGDAGGPPVRVYWVSTEPYHPLRLDRKVVELHDGDEVLQRTERMMLVNTHGRAPIEHPLREQYRQRSEFLSGLGESARRTMSPRQRRMAGLRY